MKKISMISMALMSTALVACGGGSGSPDKPNLCSELNVTNCDQVVIPSSASSSSSSFSPPVNDMLPIMENFAVDNSIQFFDQSYKALLDPNPEDPNNSLYYSTSGLDAGRMVAANGSFTIGNARFTIGQRLQTTGTHINPTALPADFKAETTTARNLEGNPTTTTWGDLDLTNPWKISFCVKEWQHTGTTPNNQLFMIYVDNNTSGSANSYHLAKSLVSQPNISNFIPGKRVEFNIPGDVLIEGKNIDSVIENPGTTSSFVQLRIPSSGVITMSDLWIGYQADTSTEPANNTCTTGERVPGWNVPPPAANPTVAPVAEVRDSQLAISWTALARATGYQLAYHTTNSVEGATLSADISGANTTNFTLTGLQNNQPYFVFLRGKNSGNVYTEWSPSVQATPQPAQVAPVAPQAPSLLAGDAQIEVSWEAVDGASNYQVAYNTVENPLTATIFGSPTPATSVVLTGLTNNVTYYVYVKALNSAGESAYSTSAEATPLEPVATDWLGQVVDLIGGGAVPEVGTAPSGSITEEDDGAVIVLRATGGIMNSDSGFRTFFAHKPVSGQFQFTARIASVTTASGEFTARGNTFGYGIMVMQDVPQQPVPTYTDVPRFATVNLYTNTIAPTFNGSRALKADSASGNRSRSNIDGLSIGHYVRLQVFVDTQNPNIKRVRRYTSTNGIDFTQVNSTPWTGTVGDDWYVGFYGAPGDEDLFIRFDNIVLEPYDPSEQPSSSSAPASSAASVSSSTVVSSSAPTSSASPASSSSLSSSAVQVSTSSSSSSSTPASSSSFSSSDAPTSSSSFSSSNAPTSSSSISSTISGGVSSSDTSSSSSSSSIAPVWNGEALSLVGTSTTEPSGNISVNSATAVTLTATGGDLSSANHHMFFAHQQIAKSDFVFTARIASVNGVTTASTNTYRFGLMVMSDINPVASYADLAPWADIGFYVNTTPALTGSRANLKTDGTRSRSDISGLAVGNYVRIEVYDAAGGLKRVRRLTSTDGITFTQANSTTDFKATDTTDNWFVGLYAAPGVNELTIEFDNIVIEDYVAPTP